MKKLFLNKSNIIIGLLLLTIALLISRALIANQGFPRTDDLDIHAARIANYYLAIKQGQFPPRWAPNAMGGFGYPVFNFVYPVPYIISSALFVIGFTVEQSINAVLILSIVIAVISSYLLAQSYGISKLKSLAISAIYTSFPYTLATIFIRGALGEIFFMGLLPLVMLSLRKLHTNTNRKNFLFAVLVFLLTLFSHQLSMTYIFPVIIGWLWISKKNRSIKPIIYALVTTFFIGQIFILPMVLEARHTVASSHSSIKKYVQYFVPLKDIIWSKWQYEGFTNKGDDVQGTFSKMIGPAGLLILALSLFKSQKLKHSRYWLVVVGIAIFFTNQASNWFWEHSIILPFFQFPFRILNILSIAITFLLIDLIRKNKISNKQLGTIFILSITQIIFFAKPIGYIKKDSYQWLEYPKPLDSSNENLPKWFDQEKNADISQKVFSYQDGVEVDIKNWNGTQMNYQITTPEESTIFQKTMYFPGWELFMDGEIVKIDYQNSTHPGIISYALQPGDHTISTSFTQNTPSRKFGSILSIIGVGGLLWILKTKAYASQN